MLEHVALNQTRFNTPGVTPDSRGILLGKQGALLFTSIDRLVGFFRVFCDESSMDDLLPKLKIEQVKSPLESRELVVFFHATSSYLADRVARLARMVGGLSFTGSGKHYVKYRDNLSPLGYDVHILHAETADYAFYSDSFTQGYQRIKEVPFSQLVFRLSPRALPGLGKSGLALDEVDRELLWLTARRGLSRSLLSYLWRNRVRVEATIIDPDGEGQGSAFSRDGSLLLARIHQLPARMLQLFSCVPGIQIYRPVGEHCLVEVGYVHPLRLESCLSIFEAQKLYLFAGSRDAVDVLPAPLLVPAQDLIGGGFVLEERSAPRTLHDRPPEKFEIPLKLVYSGGSRRRVTATLIPWSQAGSLKRLVYALPPTMLSSLRVQAIPEGLFVIGDHGIDGLPIGSFFQEVANSIYVPLGFEFQPRVSAEVLTEHLGGVAGRSIVFPPAGPPVSLDQQGFEPLGRHVLARLSVEPRTPDPRLPTAPTVTPATVINEDVGVLPLWGFRADRRVDRERDAVAWLHGFVRPLVAGGDVRVLGVMGQSDLAELFEMSFDRGDEVALIAEARHGVISELLLAAAQPQLDSSSLRLAAAVQDLLFLLHPQAGGARRSRLHQVAEFAERCASLPAPTHARDLAERHSMLHHLYDLSRDDVQVTFWAGRRDFRGREPPARLLKWQRVRRVHEERTRVAILAEALTDPKLRSIVTALLASSPLTDLLNPVRLDPPFDLAPLALWLRDQAIARAIAARYLQLGFVALGPVYTVALLALYNAKHRSSEARTATAFLCHLQLLQLLGSPPARTLSWEERLGELKGLCAGRDNGLYDFFGLFAAAGRVGLQRPSDLTRDPALTATVDEYARACAALCGERRLTELIGVMARGTGEMALAS